MKKSQELKVLRSSKVDEQQALLDLVSNEKRSMTTEENTSFDSLESEIESLNGQIERAEKMEAAQARNATLVGSAVAGDAGEKREYADLLKRANLVDFIAMAKEERVEGASRELAEETAKRIPGYAKVEGRAIPVEMLLAPEKRTASTVFDGNNAVPSFQGEFAAALRPTTTVLRAGARMLTGLNGELILPSGKAGEAVWEGEVTENTDNSGAGLDGVKLSPKRLFFNTGYSKMLAKTVGALQAEAIFRDDALLAIGEGIDRAAISGAAGGNSPVGILNMTGTNSVVIGTNGGALTYAKVLEMLQKQFDANAFRENMSFLTSARTFFAAHQISKDAGSGRFLIEENNMQGIPAMASSFVPTNGTKGSGTALSSLILGWFPGLSIGQFGVLDLVVDPYSLKKKGQDEITINGYFDVQAAHKPYFTVIKDLTT